MKRKIRGILAAALAAVLAGGAVPAIADDYTNDFFDNALKAYGTNIQYIEDLGQYVIGGKSFYTSTDGVNWIRRGGAIADSKQELAGFAYGGSNNSDSKYFLMIPIQSNLSDSSNKIMLLDKYMASRKMVYTYINDNNEDPDDDVSLLLKGSIIWDEYTGKFWCGASKADGTYAGLYYSDGSMLTLSNQNRMYWTKVDTGVTALYAESTAYTTTPTKTVSVLSNITSDGKGHIVAQANWSNSAHKDAFSNQTTGTGAVTDRSALLVNAETDGQYQAKTMFIFNSLAYIGIDRYSNIIAQAETNSTTASSRQLIRTYSFDNAFEQNNGTALSGWGYINEEKGRYFVRQDHGNSGVIGKIVSLEDKLIMIPRAGYGKANATEQEDIWVATYDSDDHSLTDANNKFYTYINNDSKVTEILASSAARHYVADAVAVGNNKVAVLTGKKTTAITTAIVTGVSLVATIDLTDAPTGDISQNTSETGFAGDVDRSNKVTIASSTGANGNKYSHIAATSEESTITAERDTYVNLASTAYDGLDAATPHEADNAGNITYTILSNADNYDGVFDFDEVNSNGIYVWEDARGGSYRIDVLAVEDEQPMIRNIITYTIEIPSVEDPSDLTVTVNGSSYGVDVAAYSSVGLVAGDNTITAVYNKDLDINEYYTIIAVYDTNNQLIGLGMSDVENNPSNASCNVNIPASKLSGAVFRVFVWDTNLNPV